MGFKFSTPLSSQALELPTSLGAYLMLLSLPDDGDVVAFDEPLASSSKMDVKDESSKEASSDDDDDEQFSSVDTDATDATDSTTPSFNLSLAIPEHALAAQILQIIGVAIKELHLSLFHSPLGQPDNNSVNHNNSANNLSSSRSAFLPDQIAHLLVHVLQMFEDSSTSITSSTTSSNGFKRVVDALRLIARQPEEEVMLKGLLRLSRINSYFVDVAAAHPTLTLLWARMLTHLRWATTNMDFWKELMTTTTITSGKGRGVDEIASFHHLSPSTSIIAEGNSSTPATPSSLPHHHSPLSPHPRLDIVRTGAIVALCDSVVR